MKTFNIKIEIEQKIYADNEQEAVEHFWEWFDMSAVELHEHMKVKEVVENE